MGNKITKNSDIILKIKWELKEPLISRLNAKHSLARSFPSNNVVLHTFDGERNIESALEQTNSLGEQSLWKGYEQNNAKRNASVVSTVKSHGRFFVQLVNKAKPKVIVEFGTAFGISGMYWLSAIELVGAGHLYTYEVNSSWAKIADKNLGRISKKYTLTKGLFEENLEKTLKTQLIDIAFIDGVHTYEWVLPQFNIVASHMNKNGIIVLDDINFGESMLRCWKELIKDSRVKNAFLLDEGVGVIQVK